MSKKNKQKNPPHHTTNPQTGDHQPTAQLVSKRGWKVIGGGAIVLIAGYSLLSMADPMAQNWAGRLSPFVIIGGYVLIGLGIVVKDSSI
jgi:hypothetical protein